MQDAAEIPYEFRTLAPAPAAKHGCLATHIVVADICALLGAAVNEAVRQQRLGSVSVTSLQNASWVDTAVPLCGPGENVLISSVGRQPQRNVRINTIQTAETFELSFDVTPHDSAPANSWRNIVHFGNSYGSDADIPGFWLKPGSTRLREEMSRQDILVACDPEGALPVGQVTRVGVLLVGDTFTVSFNGQQQCSTGGFLENRVPAQPNVDVWLGDLWYTAADVTVANLLYRPLYTCGTCGPVG